MEVAIGNALEELSAMGVDVTPYKTKGGSKQMIWNEVGEPYYLSVSSVFRG
jgi:hypothetical protein